MHTMTFTQFRTFDLLQQSVFVLLDYFYLKKYYVALEWNIQTQNLNIYNIKEVKIQTLKY